MKTIFQKGKITLCNKEIPYLLTRKNMKSVIVKPCTDGSLKVSAPFKVPLSFIEGFIIKNEKSILKMIEADENKTRCSIDELDLSEGEEITVWGKKKKLRFLKGEISYIAGENLFLSEDKNASYDKRRKALENFLKKEVESYLLEISEEIYKKYFFGAVSKPDIIFKNLKSRWGSCCKAKNLITYNRNLIFLPKEFAFYVAVHEFCHLIVFNHSKEFYACVEKIMPDYKEIKNLGRDYTL